MEFAPPHSQDRPHHGVGSQYEGVTQNAFNWPGQASLGAGCYFLTAARICFWFFKIVA